MARLALETPFSMPAEDIASALGCDPAIGLSSRDVAARQEEYGKNLLHRWKAKNALGILAHQFSGIIVWLLAGAAGVSLFLGDLVECAAIAAILVINGAIGFFTELRATRSMESLLRIARTRTLVRRAGAVRKIDAVDLVPGDIVLIHAGDVVTADLRVLAASNLHADESVLTGESVPVTKSPEPLAPDTEIADRTSMVFKGTAITQGAGEGIVVATGMRTEIGRISDLVQRAEAEVSPLERRLDRLGQRLVWLTLGLALLTVAAGVLWGHGMGVMVQTGIALAVAAVPEGLPIVATLCLARGMWRMAARNALITQLSSVETLGSTTLILTDKTGTLTENEMAVVRYLLAGGDLEFDADEGRAEDARLAKALLIGALCNSAEPGDGSAEERAGDPMEIALLTAADAAALTRPVLRDRYPRAVEHAFDPGRKMMATVHADGDGFLYAVKGAPEAVIVHCDEEFAADGPRSLGERGRADWARRHSKAARDGLRLLALAMKTAASSHSDPYEGLMLVGLVCLMDPLRDDVPAAIRASLDAGVRVVMLTGDHADTAATIARDAGLGAGDLTLIEGRELRGLNIDEMDEAMRKRILAADVFARVAPETKLTLVALFQDDGHIVAMTGDGVNDAPALKKADIGIAMGLRGTEVAREAADMVLKDDAFATIIAAMRQGRVIFDNIRKFVVYLMSCNVSEVLVVGIAVGAGLPPPLLPLQILFLNLVTDVFPAFALGLGRGDGGVMRRPPRDPGEPIVGRPEWLWIGLLGVLITIATLSAFALALFWLRLGEGAAVTVAFLTLALAQLWNVFNARMDRARLFRNDVTRNGFVWAAIGFCAALLALVLWVPALSELLDLPHPGVPGLALAVTMSLGPLVAGQALLLLRVPARLRGRRHDSNSH